MMESSSHGHESLIQVCKARGINPAAVCEIRCIGCGVTERVDGVPTVFGFGHFDGCFGEDDDLRFRISATRGSA